MQKRLAWAWVLVALAVSTAWAQAKPDYEAAKRHYLAGKDASARGDFGAAVKEYILAYDITKDPTLFKQIGAAYEAGGKRAEATAYYRRYLAEAKPGTDVDDVRARLAALEGKKVEAPATAPARAEPMPPEPPKLPPPEPQPAPTPELAPAPPPPASFSEGETRWQRTTAWIFVGLAAVGVTTGAVLATSAISRQDDIQRLLDFRDPVTGLPNVYAGAAGADYNAKVDEGKNFSKWATVSFISAGAFAGAATLFFILDASRSAPTEKVSVAPFAGPGSAGVVAGWGF